MLLNALISVLQVLVLSLAPLGLVAWAVFKVLLPVAQKQIEQATHSLYARNVEFLKSELELGRDYVKAHLAHDRDLLGLVAAGYSSSQDKRLEAILALWSSIVKSREFFWREMYVYHLMVPTEYVGKSVSKTRLAEFVPTSSEKDLTERLLGFRRGIEESRPLLGERLWLMFFVHQALGFGIISKLCQSIDKHDRIPEWNKFVDGKPFDRRPLLLLVLSEDELSAIEKISVAVPMRILSAIEDKMLSEMHSWILGKQVIELTIAQRDLIWQDMPPLMKTS
ncbi:MAG: hypothetical protein HYR64_01930 [Fimbriimonas ginsengisoli]|uniref:Uncharacterized protein n=1 Tax=Fimbriimonas ginsengisoli TaxID=1005039 RepID=A0A931PV40_FIMGI|nr:hypothetical protein [Fimbriimonas ginsengisoli]